MPTPFDSGTFRQLADSPVGQGLWDFLNEHDNVVRMEAASDLEHPAVEVLSRDLLQRFKKEEAEVRQDRTKQMIGRMVRQILEARGYRIDRQNVRISAPSNMFSSGTRYRLSDGQRQV